MKRRPNIDVSTAWCRRRGMSTVPEVIVARHCGIRCFGISIITDLGVEGKIVEVSHEEVQKAANAVQPKMAEIFRELIKKID